MNSPSASRSFALTLCGSSRSAACASRDLRQPTCRRAARPPRAARWRSALGVAARGRCRLCRLVRRASAYDRRGIDRRPHALRRAGGGAASHRPRPAASRRRPSRARAGVAATIATDDASPAIATAPIAEHEPRAAATRARPASAASPSTARGSAARQARRSRTARRERASRAMYRLRAAPGRRSTARQRRSIAALAAATPALPRRASARPRSSSAIISSAVAGRSSRLLREAALEQLDRARGTPRARAGRRRGAAAACARGAVSHSIGDCRVDTCRSR